MRKTILEILQNNIIYFKDDVEIKKPLVELAKEIESHIREFHDWLENDNTPNAFEKNYQYWKDNIKNK